MKKRISIFLVLLFCFISSGIAGNEFAWRNDTYVVWGIKTNAPKQSVAVSFSDWCVFFSNAASEKPGVRYILNQIASSGAENIWWRTFGGGWAQYSSQVKGVTHGYYPGFGKTYGEFDPLAEAVPYAHKLGLKIYAWYTPLEEAHAWPYNVRSRYVDEHPEQMDRTSKNIAGAPSFFFKKYRKYKTDLGLEMVTRYKSDGLVIDLERRGSPGRNNTWGYLPQIVEGYKKETGIDPLTLSVNDPQWCAYRAQYVGMFIKALHDGIKKLDRPVELVVMVREKQQVSAHWNIPKWIKNGWIDRVVISSYGKEGWGSMSDGSKCRDEYSKFKIPVGLQCYTYRPKSVELAERASKACQLDYDELVWFESTPTMYHKRYNIIRDIAMPDRVELLSPLMDISGGGRIVVLAAGKWHLYIDGDKKELAAGSTDKPVFVDLPKISGQHRILIDCSIEQNSQKAGIAVQGAVISKDGKKISVQTDSSWTVSGRAVVTTGLSGVPPFLGDVPAMSPPASRSIEPVSSWTQAPGTYRAFDPGWRGKWIWGARKKDVPAFDVNLYDWEIKYPGGWGQTLVNRIVGIAANSGLEKIYWHLDDGYNRLLFPAADRNPILNWPNWKMDFSLFDMPAAALALAEKCNIKCTFVIDKKWINLAKEKYSDAEIITADKIDSLKCIPAVDNTKASTLGRKWLPRKTYFFRKEFNISEDIDSADICITAEKRYECYLDGRLVGFNSDWWQAETYQTEKIKAGKHIIAVKVEPGKSISGLLINMRWKNKAGKTMHIDTDETWLVNDVEEKGWNNIGFDEQKWGESSVVGIEGIGNRFRLKEPWRNIQMMKADDNADISIRVTASGNQDTAENVIDGNIDDSSAWRNKKLPEELIFDMPEPVKLKGIRIYSGKLMYYGNPSGASSIKSFRLDSFDNGKWIPLCSAVTNVPPYTGEPMDKAFIVKTFKPRQVSRLRLTVMDSYDTRRRIHSLDKPCIKPSQKACFIREIELIRDK